MFYVAKGKIYSTEFDAERKVYPEMRLVSKADTISLQELASGGSAERPAGRALCTFEEIVAQLGASATGSQGPERPKSRLESSKG